MEDAQGATDLSYLEGFRETVCGLLAIEAELREARSPEYSVIVGRRMARRPGAPDIAAIEQRHELQRREVSRRLEHAKRLAAKYGVEIRTMGLPAIGPGGYLMPATLFDAVLVGASRNELPAPRVIDAIDRVIGACGSTPSLSGESPAGEEPIQVGSSGVEDRQRDLRSAPPAVRSVAARIGARAFAAALATLLVAAGLVAWRLASSARPHDELAPSRDASAGLSAMAPGECVVHSPYRGREYLREREEVAERGALLGVGAPRDFVLLGRGSLQRPGAEQSVPQRIFRVREIHSGLEGWTFLERTEVVPVCSAFWPEVESVLPQR